MNTLAEYLAFAKAHPGLFVNPPQGGISILLNEDEKQEISATVSRLVSLERFHPDTRVGANVIELFYADIDSYWTDHLHLKGRHVVTPLVGVRPGPNPTHHMKAVRALWRCRATRGHHRILTNASVRSLNR